MTRLPLPLRVLPNEAEAAIADLLEYLEAVSSLVAEDYQKVVARMANLELMGGGVFDAVIAQAALKTGVDQLLTLNSKDFVRLGDEITVLVQVPE